MDDIYIIETKSIITSNYLNDNCHEKMQHILKKIDYSAKGLRIVSSKADLTSQSNHDATMQNQSQKENPPQIDGIILSDQYTFESFVVGESNRLANAACLATADAMIKDINGEKPFNPLFIHGSSGLGKTHLMRSIANRVIKHQPTAKITYMSCERFTNELVEAISKGKTPEFRSKYRENIDLLLLDDIQFLAKKESTQEELHWTFNTLMDSNKQIVISSDRPPEEIPTLEERLRTRFKSGMSVDIQPPDRETRSAILLKKAHDKNYNISNEVIDYMANEMNISIREMEGALLSLNTYAVTLNKPITIEFARTHLKLSNRPTVITNDDIVLAICERFNQKREHIISKKRQKELVRARHICMYLCRKLTDMSLKRIAECYGLSDHTSAMHAIEKIETEIDKNAILKSEIEAIIANLKI